ncbi:TetR/AcrR family transcriptional regulator [Pseudonocardia cypriaca]|uniref:TetR family transcriptional regulator n=1 Tax=Pseudonocardia cypriaca TaxID=882449 RepID=A0A543GB03_9PSEU|nr:TetR/AcrR family transcriptional regulator [Pseudonocardia cypriaca]TQM43261.1 TetR family transcriptional regulator [Pseudonocardia cypriaca]
MDTRPVRRRVGRAERERQILDAAIAVFGERGYQSASMDQVAERVGVTKPVLYTHFGSKHGLLLACIARARAELLEVTSAAAASAATPEEMLRRGTLAFFDYLERQAPEWTILYGESAVAGEAIEEIRAQQTDFIATLLAAQAPGTDPQRLTGWAQVIVGACERLALWRARAGITSEEATGYLMDLVWTGLSGGAAGPANPPEQGRDNPSQ